MRKEESCRVQEEIKLGRGGRQVQISFPDDVLHSGRLQNMLESKVMILKTKWTYTYLIFVASISSGASVKKNY